LLRRRIAVESNSLDDPGTGRTTFVDFYKSAFALGIAERLDFETFTLVYLRNSENDFELELTINKDQTKPYDLGDGYGHKVDLTGDAIARFGDQRIGAAIAEPLPVRAHHLP